jgi:4-amino-4-deoxy-L-arabinose transferase-like glycosyltransferase
VSVSRLWLALVLALFCFPLFVGLDRTDVESDEAIYSYGVDRILESGDWLAPKSSPHEHDPFLEKPPLKFWIVAAPIKLGLLPHDEFGLRFWDALFGAVSFLYVFAIGSRLAGPICGAVAVLFLFAHNPLLFDHGLRSNNMEAALMLAYCGGVYHYVSWQGSAAVSGRKREPGGAAHAFAVGLYFTLGFMCKFVAAVFLPMVLAAATLVVPGFRRTLAGAWRLWAKVAALVLALCAPWFIYAHLRFGSYLWQVILGEHVYQRFTTYLDPAHLGAWYYYPQQMYRWLGDGSSRFLVVAGLALLLVQAIRRRAPDAVVVLSWLVLPVLLISMGTSKLYHYAYPFLPPLALAAGYLVSIALAVAPVPVARGLEWVNNRSVHLAPRALASFRRPAVRSVLLAVAAAAIVVALVTVVAGPIRISYDRTTLFRSSGVLRPAVVAIVAGVVAGAGRAATRAVVPLLAISLLPLPAYRETLSHLDDVRRPWSDAIACVQQVQAAATGRTAPGLYVDVPDQVFAVSHGLYYYFRRLRPWARAQEPSPAALAHHLDNPSGARPILVWDRTYQEFRRTSAAAGAGAAVGAGRTSPPMVTARQHEAILLLPGPFAVCAEKAHVREAR